MHNAEAMSIVILEVALEPTARRPSENAITVFFVI
jgi:hypothetical protein